MSLNDEDLDMYIPKFKESNSYVEGSPSYVTVKFCKSYTYDYVVKLVSLLYSYDVVYRMSKRIKV